MQKGRGHIRYHKTPMYTKASPKICLNYEDAPMMIFIFMSSQNIFLFTLTAEALNCLLPSFKCSARFSRSLSFPSLSRTFSTFCFITFWTSATWRRVSSKAAVEDDCGGLDILLGKYVF